MVGIADVKVELCETFDRLSEVVCLDCLGDCLALLLQVSTALVVLEPCY